MFKEDMPSISSSEGNLSRQSERDTVHVLFRSHLSHVMQMETLAIWGDLVV